MIYLEVREIMYVNYIADSLRLPIALVLVLALR